MCRQWELHRGARIQHNNVECWGGCRLVFPSRSIANSYDSFRNFFSKFKYSWLYTFRTHEEMFNYELLGITPTTFQVCNFTTYHSSPRTRNRIVSHISQGSHVGIMALRRVMYMWGIKWRYSRSLHGGIEIEVI